MTTNKPEVVGFATHHDEPMLFPSKREAAMYCDEGEEPVALIRLSDYEALQAEQVPDAIQLLQRVAASTTDKPAVAVPEEMTKMKAIDLIPEVDDDYGSNLFVKGWNICRAAMLASNSQQTDQRITEKDARDLITRYALWRGTEYNESMARQFISGWLSFEGNKLIAKLNSTRAAQDYKPAVAVPDFETWWRSLPSYRDADKPAAKMAWDYLARLVTSQSHSQQSAQQIPECFKKLTRHAVGMCFGADWNNGTAATIHIENLINSAWECDKYLSENSHESEQGK